MVILLGTLRSIGPPNEIEEVKKFDPILKFQKALFEMKYLNPRDVEKMEGKIKSEIDEAVAFAENSPVAGVEELLEDVYA